MPSVNWYGEDFDVAEEVSDFLLDEYLEALAAEDMTEVKASRMRLLKAVIGPKRWARFRKLAVENNADDLAMFEVLRGAFEAVTEDRPTGRSIVSSDGPPRTARSSAAGSSSRVIARLEEKGRPDLALIALKRQESQTA